MRCRTALVSLALVVSCFAVVAPSPARAARIDPELQRILDEHAKMEIIPVIMLYPESAEGTLDSLDVQLEMAVPSKRRDGVIVAMKKHARKIQSDAWAILEDPDHPGVLAYSEMLYMANAIAFGGDSQLILAVAGNKSADDAVLFFDKDYDLLTAQRQAAPRQDDGIKSARGDTVWNVKAIHADRVWNELGYKGDGIIVGHVDTGVWMTHPDLRDHIWVNPAEIPDNGVDDDGNGYVDDVHGWDFGDHDNDPTDDAANAGHGTHTAGTLAGDGTGGIQTGVAPDATIMPCKVFNQAGGGSLGSIWEAQQYCAENGARIITMSVSIRGDIPTQFLRNDRYNALSLRSAGVTVFNSSGNDHGVFAPPIELGMTARIPAPWRPGVPYSSAGGIISVGGTAYKSDAIWSGSSQGPADWGQVDPWFDWPYDPGTGLVKPDIVAPAQGINSTFPPSLYSGETWTGTSMACPHAAGVAALMLQKNPTLSPAGIDSTLEMSAIDRGDAGKDNVFGAGMLDAYAAVSAVSMAQVPNLEEVAFLPDPDGNQVLDPGELPGIVFTLANVGQVAATNVIGRLRVVSNPFVAISGQFGSDRASFPDLAPGEQASNAASPFKLVVSTAAPQGFPFTLLLTVMTGEGFERTFDIPTAVGLPEFRTHDVGHVYLTVTDQGGVGYLDDSRAIGQGMGVQGQESALFISSLWAGTDASYVCNNDLTGNGADPVEWRTRLIPVGRVAVASGPPSAQTFSAAFTDSGHANPRGIEVRQISWAHPDPPYDDVVMVQYAIVNTGDATITDYYAGLFADFDVMDSLHDVGGVDTANRAVWIKSLDGPCYGVAVLGDTPVSNISLIDNLVYIYADSYMHDDDKMRFLRGDLTQGTTAQESDWSSVAAAGPFTLAPESVVLVTFAFVYGDDEAHFLANVQAANNGYSPVVAVDDGPRELPASVRLQQNLPNPFNPDTAIRYTVPTSGAVDLAVYDVSGRRVRTLVTGTVAAGEHTVHWNGRDENGGLVPSGLYLYRVVGHGATLTRKMMLVK